MYGRNLYVMAAAYIGSLPLAAVRQVYGVTFHEIQTGCAALALTLLDTTQLWSYVNGDCWPGTKGTLTLDTAAEIVPDTECRPQPSPCASFPRCLVFGIAGVTDDECGECQDFRSPSIVLYRNPGKCVWYGNVITGGSCLAAAGATHGQWVLVFNIDTATWTLSFVVLNALNEPIGVLVTYKLVGDSALRFPKALALESFSDACQTWPVSIQLMPCNIGNLTYGACCRTEEKVATIVCEETTQVVCQQLFGLFLGANTRCALEGCGGCAYPGPCSAFCDQYELALRLFGAACWTAWWDAIVAAAPLVVLLTQVGDPTDDCTWTYLDGPWDISLTINTGTTPRTWTLQINYNSGEEQFSLTAVAVAFCNAPNIGGFAVTAFSSVGMCEEDPPSSYLIQLAQWSGCPEFNG
jgi:hypothetical protein